MNKYESNVVSGFNDKKKPIRFIQLKIIEIMNKTVKTTHQNNLKTLLITFYTSNLKLKFELFCYFVFG